MASAGATKEEISQKMRDNEKILELILKNSSYSEYQKLTNNKGDISKTRWGFIKKNVNSDASEDLSKAKKLVKLIVGGRDENIDVYKKNP